MDQNTFFIVEMVIISLFINGIQTIFLYYWGSRRTKRLIWEFIASDESNATIEALMSKIDKSEIVGTMLEGLKNYLTHIGREDIAPALVKHFQAWLGGKGKGQSYAEAEVEEKVDPVASMLKQIGLGALQNNPYVRGALADKLIKQGANTHTKAPPGGNGGW